MQRYDYLRSIAGDAKDALVVCTGWSAREWWALRPGDGNLKTRTLGLVSSIAAGLALALPHRKVIAIDGDGAFLMNLCGLPTIASQNPGNLIHLLFDNEIYEASGGTATASPTADAVALAKGAGYRHASWVKTREAFRAAFSRAWQRNELTLIAVKTAPGQPDDLPPLRLDEIENKYRFMRYLEATEQRAIVNPGFDSKL
jgi:thiamine pyrophosphate-dependent acetolactate synthase large subunit-like protein